MGLEQLPSFMAAIRRMESGSYEGNYSVVNSIGARGAYQILTDNWASWAKQAGIPGADWRDPRAQDTVARYKMIEYYNRYGSWDLVAMAWHGGPGTVAEYLQTGQLGPRTTSYVSRYAGHMAEYERLHPTRPPAMSADAAERFTERTQSLPPPPSFEPWYQPVYLDPNDRLAQFLTASASPPGGFDIQGPTAGQAVARLLTSLSQVARQRAGGEELLASPGEPSLIDLSQQEVPGGEG